MAVSIFGLSSFISFSEGYSHSPTVWQFSSRSLWTPVIQASLALLKLVVISAEKVPLSYKGIEVEQLLSLA